EEAYLCGVKAIELAEEDVSGVMVSILRASSSPYRIKLSAISLDEVALGIKPLDDKYINTRGNFVTDKYLDYIKPLVGELPAYSELKYIKF
ncbi:MAG: phosphofructokinase, partial [Candidatus Caldatribacteriota bacterium]